jgi:hypothetical protein
MAEHDRLPRGMTPRLLSVDAAAAYLGVHRETFEQHVRPQIPPIEIGARKLWDIKALDHWLDQQCALNERLRPADRWLGELEIDLANSRR